MRYTSIDGRHEEGPPPQNKCYCGPDWKNECRAVVLEFLDFSCVLENIISTQKPWVFMKRYVICHVNKNHTSVRQTEPCFVRVDEIVVTSHRWARRSCYGR